MHIRVESYAGDHTLPMPRALHFEAHQVEIAEVIDQWYGPDYRYVKVKGDDGALYILRFDEIRAEWQLTMFESPRAQALSSQSCVNRLPRSGHRR
jgi:hypothetical protein